MGRMLQEEALKYQIDIQFLDPDADAPCAKVKDCFHQGSFKDFDTVYRFGQSCDILSIEIEHVNIDALEKLEAEGKIIIPAPKVLRIIQNKRLQKEFYKQHGIATSEFIVCTNKEELKKSQHLFPIFQKLETDGYDGKGVQLIRSMEDLEKAFDKPSILEKKVKVNKEISVIIAGNQKGQYTYFPPVEMVFDPVLNLVDYQIAPADITPEQEKKCIELAMQTAKAFEVVGLLAVEMFINEAGQVLVNEVAPRAHNSGHHTIEACYTSQFEQQLRILLDLPLGDTGLIQPGMMINLVGEPGYEGKATLVGLDKINSDRLYVHLYGKKITKPGRKMGHVTILGKERKALIQRVEEIKQHLKVIAE